MADGIYIGTLGPQGGKSLVLLGVLELLSKRVDRLAVFRPVIRGGERRDTDIELARSRYNIDLPYDSLYALTRDEVRQRVSSGEDDGLLQDVFDSVKDLGRCFGCDAIFRLVRQWVLIFCLLIRGFRSFCGHLAEPLLILYRALGNTGGV